MSEGTDGTDTQALSASETTSPARRVFLKNALTGAAALTLASGASKAGLPAQAATVSSSAQSGAAAVQLAIVRRILEVNGRAASVYGIHQPDGTPGIRVRAGGAFSVNLKNTLAEPTSVHWHGLTPPWPSDGVPGAPLPALAPGASRAFDFPVREAGTYWMHAHTLQEQQLLAAPLIVTERASARRDEQDVVMLLHDFSFRSPQALLAGLTNPRGKKGGGRARVPVVSRRAVCRVRRAHRARQARCTEWRTWVAWMTCPAWICRICPVCTTRPIRPPARNRRAARRRIKARARTWPRWRWT